MAGEKTIFLLRRQPTGPLIEDAFSREGMPPAPRTFVDTLLSGVRGKFRTLGLPLEILTDTAYSAPESPFPVPSQDCATVAHVLSLGHSKRRFLTMTKRL